ncbi:MAG: hypothetical protein AABX01_06445 [Candidatus Micrarchaeota archaeon]
MRGFYGAVFIFGDIGTIELGEGYCIGRNTDVAVKSFEMDVGKMAILNIVVI